MAKQEPHPVLVREFLLLNRFAAVALVLKYKAKLCETNETSFWPLFLGRTDFFQKPDF